MLSSGAAARMEAGSPFQRTAHSALRCMGAGTEGTLCSLSFALEGELYLGLQQGP